MSTSLQPVHALVPGANLEAYVHAVNGIPLLTPEQERELAESLYYKQDLEAARQMVLQIQAEGHQWLTIAPVLARCPATVLIDHFGRTVPGDASGAFEALLFSDVPTLVQVEPGWQVACDALAAARAA